MSGPPFMAVSNSSHRLDFGVIAKLNCTNLLPECLHIAEKFAMETSAAFDI